MKKTIIFLAALGLMMQSCVVSTDKDNDKDARIESVKLLQEKMMTPLFYSIELADFFDRFQDIRTDKEKVLLLGYEYFGDSFMPSTLLYEEFNMGNWGKIMTTDAPDIYLLYPMFYSYQYYDIKVEALGGRRYHIVAAAPDTKFSFEYYEPEMKVEIDAYVDCSVDGVLVIEEMSLKYTEYLRDGFSTAVITTVSSAVKVELDTEDYWADMIPYEGELNYKLSGSLFDDEFTVSYSEGGYRVL